MTRISEVHGIPTNEYRDRGRDVKPLGYMPFLSLSVGQMRLALAEQRANTLAQFYGSDAPQYREAAAMLSNALHASMRGMPVHFMGAVADELQNVARLIVSAQKQTAPASTALPNVAPTMQSIGQIIPWQQRLLDCVKANKKNAGNLARCYRAANIEKIINDTLEPTSHHLLYKSMPANYSIPSDVSGKRHDHRLGVEGMAQVGKINAYALMYQWVENGVIASNASGGAGAIGSVQSSFYLAPDPELAWNKFQTSGVSSSDKWISGIGAFDLSIVTAIVGLIKKALDWAFKFLSEIKKIELLALSEARGFGTPEFSASQRDWELSKENPEVNQQNQLLTLVALGLGVYLLAD